VKKPARNLLLLLLGLLILAPPVAYWAIDAWLESSGGRQVLAKNLSERTGMNVTLGGEFDLMLLPDIGVTGTDLAIESPLADQPFARSAEYEISVALRPLLNGQLQVDWIRLSGGEIRPGRYRAGPPVAGEKKEAGTVRLPRIEELTIRDFRIIPPGSDNEGIEVSAFRVSGFADRRSAPFSLEIRELFSAQGSILLDMQDSSLQLKELSLERSGQRMTGEVCMNIGDPFSLHLVLEAQQLDLDLLRQDLPDTGSWAGDGGEGAPADIRLRLSVDELLAAGAVARGAVLSLGEEPVCGSD
jgi:uncharacterized protein involved in outer membrane biogenesis